MVAELQNSGKKDIIIFLKSLLVIFDSKALAFSYLLCISIMKLLKSIQLE